MNNNVYILGIDGGGTNTRGVIFNSEGKLLVELNDSGSNNKVTKLLL